MPANSMRRTLIEQFNTLPGFGSLVLLLLILACLSGLNAQSIREQEHFTYIMELYTQSDRYLNEVATEIEAFRSMYPNSSFSDHLDYLSANIALKRGDYQLSLDMYPLLLQKNLHPDIIGDIHLNYAIALYYTEDYTSALKQLDLLAKTVDQPFYNKQVHAWRGRILTLQSHYLSAANEYQLALQYDDTGVRYDYFLVLLKLQREEEALALMESVEASLATDYHYAWLEYLLSQEDYEEFDVFLATKYTDSTTISPELGLLRVRKALELEDFEEAAVLLAGITFKSDTKSYYQALLWKQQGLSAAADSLFASMLHSPERDVGFHSYLERLKLLFAQEPFYATLQLKSYIQSNQPQRGEPYHQLGYFLLQQDYLSDAVYQFLLAEEHEMPSPLADRNTFLIAETYFRMGRFELAADASNRYLNQFVSGRYRDQALYHLGQIHYQDQDYRLASTYFENLISQHPQSPWVDEARFHLGEMRFLASEYEQAAGYYHAIVLTPENYLSVLQRLAQTYYFLGRYAEALHTLSAIPDSFRDFDTIILLAGIQFSQKEYETALATYARAKTLAQAPSQQTEAISYQAYTLYYLKRFQEASQLFYQLSRDSLNADIYLYQAAKSAAQGKQWQRALDLYDSFLDHFPDSPHFLSVLAEIANTQYNLGNYEAALDDWLNLLRRFTANTSVSSEEQALLNEVFTGIEICSRRLNDPAHISKIADMLDSFQSAYIRFELEYIIVKLYANAELWAELLAEASDLRQQIASEDTRRNDLEMLMVQSLIQMDQYARADSLLSSVYQASGSRESLLKWAELAALTGDHELAIQRYVDAWSLQPDPLVWQKALDLSAQKGYHRFSELWDLGSRYLPEQPQARLYRLRYLFDSGDLDTAIAEADSILETELNPWLRAQTEIINGRIALARGDNALAVRVFRKIKLLHKQFPDALNTATYYYIISLIGSGARQEAELELAGARTLLTAEQLAQLDLLLQNPDER